MTSVNINYLKGRLRKWCRGQLGLEGAARVVETPYYYLVSPSSGFNCVQLEYSLNLKTVTSWVAVRNPCRLKSPPHLASTSSLPAVTIGSCQADLSFALRILHFIDDLPSYPSSCSGWGLLSCHAAPAWLGSCPVTLGRVDLEHIDVRAVVELLMERLPR
jgi:hypothetical protein